ncbi:MAG TPA: CAP domain-containing protein [Xanthobacteraceae bacterium]|nr:CAP domain-containing protein [Xanthobacteraceae bacterium]
MMKISFPSALAACLFAAAVLSGCAETESGSEPSFYRNMARQGVQVDTAAAASMISGYRRNNGLEPVTVDPALNRLAEQQAAAMARSDKLDHNAGGPFAARMKAAGYSYKGAAENIGAGYYTLAEAFSGWRDSPPHRANMLLKGATRVGIAAIYRPDTKYKVFWSMILAAPPDQRSAGG